MATTKYKIAEQALRILNGGNPPRQSKVRIQELMVAVNQAFAKAVKLSMFQNFREGEKDVAGAFIYAFDNTPVVFDENKKLYYADLPATYIDLPNEMGIGLVSMMQDQTNDFVRVPNNWLSLSRGLASGQLEGRKGYFAENNRLYLVNVDTITGECLLDEGLLVKLTVALDGIDDTTNIGVPPDIQDDIIKSVVQLYSVQEQNAQNPATDNVN
jgi:hypothetical protein